MAQQIRYATSADGVRIAFTATGSGPPLVLVPNPLLSLILDYDRRPAWYDTLAKQCRLITYDVRGVGASQSAPGPFTVEAALQDLSAVVHAESIASFGIMTFGDGAPIGLAYAARHPECVEALLVFNGWGHGRDSGDDASLGVDAALSPGDHRFHTEILAQVMFNFGDAERSGQTAEDFRRSSSPEVFRSVNADLYEWDVRPLLSAVRCPVLVVQNEMGFPARDAGQRLASALPLGRLTRLTGIGRPHAADVLAFFCELTPGSQPAPESDLSPREVEVLRLLSDGLANKQIALQLGISLNTVLRHVSRVFDKTGARNRVEAAAAARKLGLLR